MEYEIVTQSPDELSEKEIGDFIAFVLAGGEVISTKLEERVRKAEQLAFLRVAGCLGGIGALKKPNGKYRRRVASASGTCPSRQRISVRAWLDLHLAESSRKGIGRQGC